jgi:hypothetical protein
MSFERVARILVFLALATSAPDRALADSVSLNTAETQYSRANQEREFPERISFDDCETNMDVTFRVTVQTTGTRNLQIWSGPEPCTADFVRDAPDCELLDEGDRGTGSFDLPLSAQTILRAQLAGESCADAAGRQGSPSARTLTLYFVFEDTTGRPSDVEGEGVSYPVTYDLLGPTAPTIRSAGAGEGRVSASWNVAEDTDVVGYRVCAAPADGSMMPGVGGGAGATGNPDCPSALLEGVQPPVESCGRTVGASAGSGDKSGLVDNEAYAVGVVGVDAVGNVGPLSAIECATPKEVSDFFEAYHQAGGKGGGGYCAMGRFGSGPLVWTCALGLALALYRRRFQ